MAVKRRVAFRWIRLSCLFAALYGLTGCGSNGSLLPKPVTGLPDVYAAGWDTVGTELKAVYWKNGAETTLDSGGYGARAEGIAVANGNVYVVGSEVNSTSGNYVAVLWTNGTPTQLTSTSHLSYASAIALSGNDVYIAGTDSTTPTTPTAAVYWKNGVETTLGLSGVVANSTALGASANAIALDSSNNVYVGGEVDVKTETSLNHSYETPVASYWTNGALTLLASPLAFSDSFGITVADGNVYVVGNSCAIASAGATQPGCSVATYWKNGTAVMQTPASDSSYSGIAISNSELYIPDNVNASSVLSSGNLAELSTNGTLTVLSTSTLAAANCAFSYNGDVYVGGADNNTAGYWDNGIAVTLPKIGVQSDVTAIDAVAAGTAVL